MLLAFFMIQNVEIKAACNDPLNLKRTLEELGADYEGLDHQIDTYFNVPEGRLKIREGTIEHNLIGYDRFDQEGPKDSQVHLRELQPKSCMKELLTDVWGIKVVVDKQRHIYFIENVKFHVDQVRDLGSFCEIEAIDLDGDIGRERLLQQCNDYMSLLGIEGEDLISCSYSDLLLK